MMVGSKNVPPSAWRLPPSAIRPPLASASATCSSTLATALSSISGPCSVAPGQAVAHAQLLHGVDQLGDEGVVHAVLHQQAIGADAGLAGVAVLARDRALHGRVEVGVVEHDERRVAAEFERQLLERAGALLHQLLADRGRAGEGHLAHDRVRRHLAADRRRRAGDDVEDARAECPRVAPARPSRARNRASAPQACRRKCSRRPAPARPCA